MCTAYTAHGIIRTVSTLQVKEPSPPRNLTAKSVNSTAIKVTWVKALYPNGVIHYRLYMRVSDEEEQANQSVYEGMDTAYVLSGLEEFVKYIFTVVSFNKKKNWTSKPVVCYGNYSPGRTYRSSTRHPCVDSFINVLYKSHGVPLCPQNGMALSSDTPYITDHSLANHKLWTQLITAPA
ncbi:hypothetical protein OS493_032345 [Desmophyllum pertusum]|uniref:Fibronectin type-III domain-containing protein n=1 Tax=Desmophyllum pertusum TaxID=174260 RepID=A0A9X0CR58_9CNID|nr:hypothetical protein OS493_032345 [Desmophyllum pertusum]